MKRFVCYAKFLFAALIHTLILTGSANADILSLKNGQSYPNCTIDSYVINNGVGFLVVRLTNPDGSASTAYSLPCTDVSKAEFGSGGIGKKGSLTALTESKEFPNVVVTTADTHPQYGFVFNVTDSDDLSGPQKIPAVRIKQIQFTPDPTASATTPSESEDESFTPPTDSSSDETKPDRNNFKLPDGRTMDEVLDAEKGGKKDKIDFSSADMSTLIGLGFGILIVVLIIVLLIQVVIQTVIVFVVCKVAQIETATFVRCFLCALYMVLLIIPCFILAIIPAVIGLAFTSIWIFVMSWLFGARAIIMGLMEVLEGTAWVILGSVIGINVLIKLFFG